MVQMDAPSAHLARYAAAVCACACRSTDGIWVGELDGGEIRGNRIICWDRHPELPLFGVNAATRAELLQDFTQPLAVQDSLNVAEGGNDADQFGPRDDGDGIAP